MDLNFDLPAESSSRKKVEAVSRQEPLTSLEGMHVLVVEDNKINQQVMKRFLGRSGVEITMANNGREGIEKVKEQQFDLILMDLQMRMMDGYEATR